MPAFSLWVCFVLVCYQLNFIQIHDIMKSWNRNIFRVTGTLWGESIYRWPMDSPHEAQWRGALMFSLICTRINGWVNNRDAGDMRRHRAYYDVIVISLFHCTVHQTIIYLRDVFYIRWRIYVALAIYRSHFFSKIIKCGVSFVSSGDDQSTTFRRVSARKT